MVFFNHDKIKKHAFHFHHMLINIIVCLYGLFTFIISFGFLGLCFIEDFCSPKCCRSHHYLDPLCWMIFLALVFPVLNILFFYLLMKIIRE